MFFRAASAPPLFRGLALPALALCALACSNDTSSSNKGDAGSASDAGRSDAGVQHDGATDATGDAALIVDKITNAGAGCETADECDGKGPTRCLTTVAGYTFPGGYCTTSCVADSECSADARCPLAAALQSPLLALLGDAANMVKDFSSCFQICTSQADCRTADGYTCASVGDVLPMGAAALGVDVTTKFCLPPAPPDTTEDGGVSVDDAGADAGLDATTADDDAGTDGSIVGDDAASEDAGADAAVATDPDAGDAATASP